MACLRVGAVLQTFHRSGILLQTSLRTLSTATMKQERVEALLDLSQLTCLVRTTHQRQKVTFTRKRRKFFPRHKEDAVTSDMRMVYENNMNRYHFWGQLVINTLAVPIYGLSLNLIISTWHLQDFSITSGLLTGAAYIALYSFLVFGVNGLCRRSIHRMYANEHATNFAAVLQDWKMMKKTVHFDLSDARRIPPGNVFGSFFGNVSVKGRSYLINPTDFIQPTYYNLLMGYDLRRSIDKDIIKDIDISDLKKAAGQAVKEKQSSVPRR